MPISDPAEYFADLGFEFHERCRGNSGACYLVASKRGAWDYQERQGRLFVAVPADYPETDWVQLKFAVTRTAIRTDRLRRLMGDLEDFLVEGGLLHIRKMLSDADTPGQCEEYILDSRSADGAFKVYDRQEVRSELRRVERDVLILLSDNRNRGIEPTGTALIEETVCTRPSLLPAVLNSLEERALIRDVNSAQGITITGAGENELEQLEREPQLSQSVSSTTMPDYDLFISHASEDKASFVRGMAQALRDRLKTRLNERCA